MAYFPLQSATGTTTDATITTVVTLPLSTGQTLDLVVYYNASSGNNRAFAQKFAQIKNISGTLTIIGTTPVDMVTLISDAGLATVAPTITVSGTNVLIRVTGIIATTINWTIDYGTRYF